MFRFTIRDVLWLTVVVGAGCTQAPPPVPAARPVVAADLIGKWESGDQTLEFKPDGIAMVTETVTGPDGVKPSEFPATYQLSGGVLRLAYSGEPSMMVRPGVFEATLSEGTLTLSRTDGSTTNQHTMWFPVRPPPK